MLTQTGISRPQGALFLTTLANSLRPEPLATERGFQRIFWVLLSAFPIGIVAMVARWWQSMPEKELNGPLIVTTIMVGALGLLALLWNIFKMPVATTARAYNQ